MHDRSHNRLMHDRSHNRQAVRGSHNVPSRFTSAFVTCETGSVQPNIHVHSRKPNPGSFVAAHDMHNTPVYVTCNEHITGFSGGAL
jgi:hypothetical protein